MEAGGRKAWVCDLKKREGEGGKEGWYILEKAETEEKRLMYINHSNSREKDEIRWEIIYKVYFSGCGQC